MRPIDPSNRNYGTFQCEIAAATGTARLYEHCTGMFYTDGIKLIAETAGAYWLIDAIALWQPHLRSIAPDFQVWDFKVHDNLGAELSIRRPANQAPLRVQRFEYTDFPVKNFTLYLKHGVLHHPAELGPAVQGLNAIQRLFCPIKLARRRAEAVRFMCKVIARLTGTERPAEES